MDESDMKSEEEQMPMAGNIKAIDRKSVHRICSGQVVLTLATAVKELIENSIDAGATTVEVKLKQYGIQTIEVIDNGSGVERKNFEGLTLKHHTSKLQDFSDLVDVETFGFRGEALSSLCALSGMTIITRHSSSDVATRLEFDHNGKISQRTTQARQVGTTVIVQNIFSTLPVRHKEFQRNIKKEFAKMINAVNSYCIISTNVRITCSNQTDKGQRSIVVSSKGNTSLKDNISNVFGPKQMKCLLEIKQLGPNKDVCTEYGLGSCQGNIPFRLEGYISPCVHGQGRSSADRQYFFINKRPCDSPKLSKVVNEVYHQYNRHQYPFVVLQVTMATDAIDVNVTPDKRQIFLQEEKHLLATIKTSLLSLYQPMSGVLPLNPVQTTHIGGAEMRKYTNQSIDEQVSSSNMTDSSLGKLKRTFSSAFSAADNCMSNKEQAAKQIKLDNFVTKKTLSASDLDLDTVESTSEDITLVVLPHSSLGCKLHINTSEETSSSQISEDTVRSEGQLSHNTEGSEGQLSQDTERSEGQLSQDTERSEISHDTMVLGCQGQSLQKTLFDTKDSLTEEIDIQTSKETVNWNLSDQNMMDNTQRDDHLISKDIDDNTRTTSSNSKTSLLSDTHLNTSVFSSTRPVCDSKPSLPASSPIQSPKSKSLSDSGGDSGGHIKCYMPSTSVLASEGAVYDIHDRGGNRMLTQEDSVKQPAESEIIKTDFDKSRAEFKHEKTMKFSMLSLQTKVSEKQKSIGEKLKEQEFYRTFRASITPTDNQSAEEELQREITQDMFSRMDILGQFNLGFIIVKNRDDLFIVDQHATDEKYNFEQLQKHTVLQSQRLIQPKNLELTASNETILMDNLDIFHQNGFDFLIDEYAPPTQRVKLVSTPVSKNWNFGKEDVEEMIFMLSDSPGVMCRPSRIRQMFASRSCRKSVMIGTALNHTEMKKLVTHMGEIDQPWNCPHGRPTMRHLINLNMVST
ncbi:mismatch repair endonuclease PMS2-like isoform X2 [Pecten maximus]|uniref:mismatch repair endonuclease PMS2-like isoform X2 n=1 Tax=Pecten maximus TaxID=6579 RepID=UPI0014581D34|nr:mismatch repair endonuclease PMS2-like isoform X2 [Pecten maximus]